MDTKAEFFIEGKLRNAMKLIGCNLVTYQRKPGGYIRVVLNHPMEEVIWVKLTFKGGKPNLFRIQTRCAEKLRIRLCGILKVIGFSE
jgi:hypothetical protein